MKRSVLTIGTFDGVHRGHRRILKIAADRAKKEGFESAAITFNIPPRLFFFPSAEPSLLTTVREKVELLRSCGIAKIHVLEFGARLARVSADAFFKNVILGKTRASQIVVGYNFGFGRNREGDTRFLERKGAGHGIPLRVIPPVTYRNVPVSSGKIRDALKTGDLKRANALLGYAYFLSGKVVPGQKMGARLGFPTANLAVDPAKIVPAGVFAVRVRTPLGKTYGGMCNVGFRPTLAQAGEKVQTVEVHLFGFSGRLYGKILRVEFVKKLRAEAAFPSLDHLRRQLSRDRLRAQRALR